MQNMRHFLPTKSHNSERSAAENIRERGARREEIPSDPVDEPRQRRHRGPIPRWRGLSNRFFGREVSRRHALEREHSRLATKYQPDRRESDGGQRGNVCGQHS